MKAVVLKAANCLEFSEVPVPSPAAGEVIVTLKAAALNHRDLWIKLGQYAGLKFPVILGSDGAGVVSSVGAGVDGSWLGREVIINPGIAWGDNERTQGSDFNILGLPRDGTLAEAVAVPAAQLSAKPAHLSWEEAAALPLSGVTAYRALVSRGGLRKGEKVLLTGIGGGVAQYLLQYAVALGAETWVSSSSQEKIDRALTLGARGGFLYTNKEWPLEAARRAGGFDLIVDSAAGEGFDALLDVAAPGGRIVNFGGTRGPIPSLMIRKLFLKQLSLLGSTMGSPADWEGMLKLVTQQEIKPIISARFPLARAAEAFDLMESGTQFGKIVVGIEGSRS